MKIISETSGIIHVSKDICERIRSYIKRMNLGKRGEELQALVDIVHILLGDDALRAQHSRVYHAAVDILFDHPRIKADGRVKVVHAAVHRFAGTSLPKLGHKKTSGVIVMNSE